MIERRALHRRANRPSTLTMVDIFNLKHADIDDARLLARTCSIDSWIFVYLTAPVAGGRYRVTIVRARGDWPRGLDHLDVGSFELSRLAFMHSSYRQRLLAAFLSMDRNCVLTLMAFC